MRRRFDDLVVGGGGVGKEMRRDVAWSWRTVKEFVRQNLGGEEKGIWGGRTT